MYMHQKNTLSSVSNVVILTHRPNYNRNMQRLQAYKYERIPDGEQERNMRRFAGARRFVYNKALDIKKTNYAAGGEFIFPFTVRHEHKAGQYLAISTLRR